VLLSVSSGLYPLDYIRWILSHDARMGDTESPWSSASCPLAAAIRYSINRLQYLLIDRLHWPQPSGTLLIDYRYLLIDLLHWPQPPGTLLTDYRYLLIDLLYAVIRSDGTWPHSAIRCSEIRRTGRWVNGTQSVNRLQLEVGQRHAEYI
jgi:hypothetical protein